ncbi:hypothetical protein E2C01_045029 [Portunus trituberculatus]|uniref:Uncharacterized protein n=1 Tax=Portunus trituberculatus TaxID=210409 RepID=A0A5B7G216_PORTR|nr:hypothetical protein [Portunus trituberculatus]
MGRRAVTAAAVTVAWCAATVMCRVLLTDSPLARTPRDAHTWHTNSLSRGREDRQGGERGGHLAGQQADNTPDDVYGSELLLSHDQDYQNFPGNPPYLPVVHILKMTGGVRGVKEGLRRERWLPNPCNSLGLREGVIDAQGLQVKAGRSLPDYQEWWQTLTRIDP